MGLHVDVSTLSQDECSHIIEIIAKDISLRRAEQARIRKLSKEFDEVRKEITLKSSKRRSLDDNCLICGRMLFKFFCFFNFGQKCLACEHMACSKCRQSLNFDNDDQKQYLCLLCVRKRDLKRKTFDWFYEIVEQKFKRFGSAKVLRGIYRIQKANPQVITLIGQTREMTYNGGQFSSSRRCSVFKMPAAPLSSSKTDAFLSKDSAESENNQEGKIRQQLKKKTIRSKSTDDLFAVRKTKPALPSRKISAPAMTQFDLEMVKTEEEITVKPMEATAEENDDCLSVGSEFEVISVHQMESNKDRKETSFTVRLFGNAEFVALASAALMLAFFLSFLACVGYIDVYLVESEEEDD